MFASQQDNPAEESPPTLPISRGFLRAAAPAMLVVLPLVGLALHSDQSIAVYQFASDYGTNPLRILGTNLAEIGEFISKGNFRPVGRFIFYLEEAARFDLALALGVGPHLVQGAMRVVMTGILAWVAAEVVRALGRSVGAQVGPGGAGTGDSRSEPDPSRSAPHVSGGLPERRPFGPMAGVFPLLFASVLIVTGPLHPLSFFPFFLITLAIAILLVPLYVASDAAIRTRGSVQARLVLPALIGLLAAMTFELLYLLPVMCLTMVVLRAVLSGIAVREMAATVAFHRWVALSIGFLIVFIPSRIAIGMACAGNDCYGNTNPALSELSVGQWLGRSLSGLPLEGWLSQSPGRIDPSALEQAWSGVSANVWLLLAAVVLIVAAIRAGKRLADDPDGALPRHGYRRLGAGLVAFGLILALLPALLVSLSEGLQEWNERGWGLHDWRDTLLVEAGWAFILYGAVVVAWSLIGPDRPVRAGAIRPVTLLAGGLAVLLALSSVLALGANARYAESRRDLPLTSVNNLISQASVDFDRTAAGDARRCALLAEYTELVCERCWHSGPRLATQLNELSISRHGPPFCTAPP